MAAYHDLFQVKASFQIAKTDPRTRPMPHHEEDTIHTHPTVVLAALAISQHPYATTDVSIHHIIHAPRPLRNITISVNEHQLTTTTPPPPHPPPTTPHPPHHTTPHPPHPPTNKTPNPPTTPRPGTGHKTDTIQARGDATGLGRPDVGTRPNGA